MNLPQIMQYGLSGITIGSIYTIRVADILGFLLLGEVLAGPTYVAISLSILAFMILAVGR